MKYGIKFTKMAGTYQYMLVIPDEHGFDKEYPIYEGCLAWYIARVKDNVLYETIISNLISDVEKDSSETLEQRLCRNIGEDPNTMHFITHCFSWAKANVSPVYADWSQLYAGSPKEWMYDTIEESFEDVTRQVKEQPPLPIEQQVNILNNINSIVDNI